MRFRVITIVIIYISVIGLISCNNVGNGDPLAFIPPDLSKAEYANVIEITKIEKETTGYLNLAVGKDYIVASGSDFEYSQHLFSKSTGEYLKSFAAFGRGPGEFPTGMNYVHFATGNDSTYYIVHLPMSTVFTYRTKEITNLTLPFKFTRLASINGKMGGQLSFTDIIPVNDRIVALPGSARRFTILYELYDINGILLDTFTDFPDIDEIKDKRLISGRMFRNAKIAIRPDGKRMVTGTTTGAYMGIYSLENDTISLLKENRYHIPKLYIKLYSEPGAFTTHRRDDDISGFKAMTSSQKRIYALYYGRVFNPKDRLCYLMEYDWDGNLLKIYKFKREIIDLQYDSTDNKLYLLYGDSDEGDFRLGYMEV